MSADWFAAFVSMIALAVSIYAVHRQDSNADGQRHWEQDQLSRREEFEKRQLEKQNEWQKVRDKELRAFEESLREPAARTELSVGLIPGDSGVTEVIVTTIVNVGQSSIVLEPPQLLLPTGSRLAPPIEWLNNGFTPYFHTTRSIHDALTNGRSLSARWEKSWLVDALKSDLGFVEDQIDLKAYFVSEAGDKWISEPLTISLTSSEDGES